MSKYAKFVEYLGRCGEAEWTGSFSDIEKIGKVTLPPSKRYPAWWSNNAFNNVFTSVWLDAGWRTKAVDVKSEKVTFVRVSEKKSLQVDLGDDAAQGAPHEAVSVPLSVAAWKTLSVLSNVSGRSLQQEAKIQLERALTETAERLKAELG